MKKYDYSLTKYAKIARQAAAEGCVLLQNENETLPLRTGDKVAVFGRCASYYYKSGVGSGGLVNTKYVVSILDALKAYKGITIHEPLLQVYEKWIKENPVDEGNGWGTVPWSQKEMPISDEIIALAQKDTNVAIVIVGRTAGEDQDNKNEAGSYLLTDIEKDMISKVSKAFERTVVLLNVSNIIDMKWVEEYQPSALMYVWQGGQEGGNGVVDVLTGQVNPCGKLTNTIAFDITDYPSSDYFGDSIKNYYKEDIYVGYRYFESCAKEKVLYPFGFGLSYTTFDITANIKEVKDDKVSVAVTVKNTGKIPGKEVVQVYIKAPQGKLGKPLRVLVGFGKTRVLESEESQELLIDCPKSYFASYDDAGITGHLSCLLLEEGDYEVYAGADVRNATYCGSFFLKEEILEQLQEACAPVETFERFKIQESKAKTYTIAWDSVPVRKIDIKERIKELRTSEIAYTGDMGYRLADVFEKKVTMEQFIAQLSEEDLRCLHRGEGMCSPKVTPGTAGAFGGVTPRLREFGIPVACCADGPSGIRMDSGALAFSLPNGTLLGCTFNLTLIEELFQMVGVELLKNKVDTILGPGINIHRNPLNGRNFEYISEDPILTGKVAAVQLKAMHEFGVTGTMKHFCANNQEQDRCVVEAVVSERALREIYLKGYEIAVKEGDARAIMTTYGPLNGIWTAGNFDLCTVILRKEWNFDGIAMTDWWASANWEGQDDQKSNRAAMVLAQNDIYMVCQDALEEEEIDNLKEELECGGITRSDLQRNAKNILNFLIKSPAMLHELGRIKLDDIEDFNEGENVAATPEITEYFPVDLETGRLILNHIDDTIKFEDIINFGITTAGEANYSILLEITTSLSKLAQIPISVYFDNIYRGTISIQGTEGKSVLVTEKIGYIKGKHHYIKLICKDHGVTISRIEVIREVE